MPSRNRGCACSMSSACHTAEPALGACYAGNAVAMQISPDCWSPGGLSPGRPAAAGLERTQVLAKLESAAAIRNAEAILEEVAGLQVRVASSSSAWAA